MAANSALFFDASNKATSRISDSGTLQVGGGIDRNTSGTLSIGGTNSTTISVGANAAATTLNLGTGSGITTITIGNTTCTTTFPGIVAFTSVTATPDVNFLGNVTIGNDTADSLAINALITTNLLLKKDPAGPSYTIGRKNTVEDSTTAEGYAIFLRAGGTSATGFNGGRITIDPGPTLDASNGAIDIGTVIAPSHIQIGFVASSGMLYLSPSATSTLSSATSQALNITGDNTSTWQTTGATSDLTVQAGQALTINGVTGIVQQFNGNTKLQITSTGATLTGQLTINGSATTATVTGTALGVVTGGPASNADLYHTHTAGSAATLLSSSIDTTAATVANNVVYVSAANAVTKAVATSLAAATAVGVSQDATASGSIKTAGKMLVKSKDSPTFGFPAYITETPGSAGQVTFTAPSNPTNVIAQVGICIDENGWASAGDPIYIIWQVLSPILIPS